MLAEFQFPVHSILPLYSRNLSWMGEKPWCILCADFILCNGGKNRVQARPKMGEHWTRIRPVLDLNFACAQFSLSKKTIAHCVGSRYRFKVNYLSVVYHLIRINMPLSDGTREWWCYAKEVVMNHSTLKDMISEAIAAKTIVTPHPT